MIVIAVFLILVALGNAKWMFWGAVIGIGLLVGRYVIRKAIWIAMMTGFAVAVIVALVAFSWWGALP